MDQRLEPKFQKSHNKRPLNLDWDALLGSDEARPAELLLKPMASYHSSAFESLESIPDHKLEESILSKKSTLKTTLPKLPDGGAKILATIKRLEDELARRKTKPLPGVVVVDDDKPGHAPGSSDVDVSTDLRQENISSQSLLQPSFASYFVKKIEDNTDSTTVEAVRKGMPHLKHCETIQENGDSEGGMRLRSSRKLPFQCPSNLSKHDTFKQDKSCRATSTFSLSSGKTPSRSFAQLKDTAQAIQSDGSKYRKDQPIVLDGDGDDDDEPCVLEKTEKENKPAECMKEARIYYPSRDDLGCVEICYSDIDCLAPECYLTSTIVNFYIIYLKQQASLTNKSLSDYQFFNTYFYKKLQEAVSCKRTERQSFFAKFRRWWKGVNIFQKAYVLIPIHEALHWSLIIICIPDKEDESGPIILHLDSLGLHSSRSLFGNIKRYLIEEKNYLDQEGMSSAVSIADRIWKCPYRRIETEVIEVPQQKNEYDCGLFVLYFIERFIEDAPERLKKKDLAMFGKEWFKPEEASSLRKKIHKLLVAELRNSISHNSSESSHSSSAGSATECVETTKESR